MNRIIFGVAGTPGHFLKTSDLEPKPRFGRVYNTDDSAGAGGASKLGFNEIVKSCEKVGQSDNRALVVSFNNVQLYDNPKVNTGELTTEIIERGAACQTIIFDFSGFTYTPPFSFILSTSKVNKRVVFCNLNPEIAQDFSEFVENLKTLKIFATRDEALAALKVKS